MADSCLDSEGAARRARGVNPPLQPYRRRTRFMCMHKLLPLFLCLFVSCSKSAQSWIVGEWVFDSEYTATKQAEKPPPHDLVGATKSMVKDQLNENMQGAKLAFTRTDFTMTTKDGNGRTFPYTVMPGTNDQAVTREDLGWRSQYIPSRCGSHLDGVDGKRERAVLL
jgi:hypothetical protein